MDDPIWPPDEIVAGSRDDRTVPPSDDPEVGPVAEEPVGSPWSQPPTRPPGQPQPQPEPNGGFGPPQGFGPPGPPQGFDPGQQGFDQYGFDQQSFGPQPGFRVPAPDQHRPPPDHQPPQGFVPPPQPPQGYGPQQPGYGPPPQGYGPPGPSPEFAPPPGYQPQGFTPPQPGHGPPPGHVPQPDFGPQPGFGPGPDGAPGAYPAPDGGPGPGQYPGPPPQFAGQQPGFDPHLSGPVPADFAPSEFTPNEFAVPPDQPTGPVPPGGFRGRAVVGPPMEQVPMGEPGQQPGPVSGPPGPMYGPGPNGPGPEPHQQPGPPVGHGPPPEFVPQQPGYPPAAGYGPPPPGYAPGPGQPPYPPGPYPPGAYPPGPYPPAPGPQTGPVTGPVAVPGPQFEQRPEGQTPTADEFAQRRAARPSDPVATMGVRGAIRKTTFGLVAMSPSRREQEYRHEVDKVRRNFGGLRQVTVVNPKGGSGKTVAVLLLAMTFGQKRGGYVLAWDNNETQGTLGMRAQQDFHNRTVRDLLRDLENFRGAQGRVGDLSQYVRAQSEGMFDVLASDESATSGEMLTAAAFADLREVVSRFYKLIMVDTGNNVRAQNWQAALDATDQLVVTMSGRNDSAETAARMLDHLEQHGRHRLVRQAASVVSMPPTRRDLDIPAITRHFAARTRTVVLAPYEKVIDSGEPLRYAQLSMPTREAWLKIAAAVADGL